MSHNPSAFPIPHSNEPGAYGAEPGMTLRDYFAAKAMAVLAHPDMLPGTGKDLETLAVAFYSMADAMLAERAKDAPR